MLPTRSKMHASRRAFLAILVSALGMGSCGGADRDVLRFTAIPDHNTTELREKFTPLAVHLSEVLGVEVEYVPVTTYSASVEAFKNGDVQLAWFGGVTGCQARHAVDGAHAIAQGRVDPNFRSYFIAHRDTGLEAGMDFPMGMEGMTFAFGSADSTSGHLMPEHFIREATGKTPQEFFGMEENYYSGSHDTTAKLVEAGTYACGAVNFRTYDTMVEEGKLDPELCRKIWTTPDYADYNWTVSGGLDERFGADFTSRLQSALVDIEDPGLLRAVDRPDGLIPAEDSEFESICELCGEFGFLN